MRKYYSKDLSHIDKLTTVDLMWNMYGLSVFSIEEQWERDLVYLTKSYEEV